MMTGFRTAALTLVWVAAFQIVAVGQIRPPNGDFETGTAGMAPPGWFFTSSSPGYEGVLVDQGCIQGHQCVMISSADRPVPNSIGNLFISLPATPYAMRRIRVRAAVRVEGTHARARMLLRVGRRGGGISFFDDMFDRPIVSSEWNYYTIDATVLDDSKSILFGVFLATPGRAWFDDVTIEVLERLQEGVQTWPGSSGIHVAAGFTPAFKYHQRILLAVFERGHKARGYVPAGDASKLQQAGPRQASRVFPPAGRNEFRWMSRLEDLPLFRAQLH